MFGTLRMVRTIRTEGLLFWKNLQDKNAKVAQGEQEKFLD